MKVQPVWIVFDIGGVILDYKAPLRKIATHLSIEEQVLTEKFFEHLEEGELGRKTVEKAWEEVLTSLGKSHEHANVIKLINDVSHFVMDTRMLIRELHAAGYKIALFTNIWIGQMDYNMNAIEEFSLAHEKIESYVEGLRKPDVRFYHLLEKRLEASGNQILFMDDTLENIQTANSIGWQTFHYTLGDDDGKTSNDILRYHLLGA